MKHLDCCTHVSFPGEEEFLHSKMFDVNMRLFKSHQAYRHLVFRACDIILELATFEKDGYPQPKGWSGANAGIPWNIIATTEFGVMINPKIVEATGEYTTSSNCGSLTLDEPVQVKRHKHIVVEYFSIGGVKNTINGFMPTVEHEIEHNLGVLITDGERK